MIYLLLPLAYILGYYHCRRKAKREEQRTLDWMRERGSPFGEDSSRRRTASFIHCPRQQWSGRLSVVLENGAGI